MKRSMIRWIFLIILFCYTNGQKPCRLYDVTTIVRLNDTGTASVQNPLPLLTASGSYEVHSRTNAVGLPIDFPVIPGYEEFKDSRQNSDVSVVFNDSLITYNSGWRTHVDFFSSDWLPEDPFLSWVNPGKEYMDSDEELIVVNGDPKRKWILLYNFEQDQAVKIRFKRWPGLKMFVGMGEGKDDGERSGKGTFFSETENGYSCTGVEFTYSNSSIVYQLKTITKKYQNSTFEEISQSEHLREISTPQAVVNLFLFRSEHDYSVCMRIEGNGMIEDCLIEVRSTNAVVLVTDEGYDRESFDFYRVNIRSQALRLTSTLGSVVTPELKPRRKSEICISLRYYIRKGEKCEVWFSAARMGPREILGSVLEGKGEVVSQEFVITLPKSLRTVNWRLVIGFQTEKPYLFLLRSVTQCSGQGIDNVIVPIIRNFEYRRPLFNPPSLVSSRSEITQNGIGLKCSQNEIPVNISTDGVKRCSNGGINIEGWCQCLPGFKGPACKEACPPNKFGADCGGFCSRKADCEGVLLAVPGNKLQCARGYYGPYCHSKCKTGFYGPDCVLKCGHCMAETCNIYSGLCEGPCKSGYAGPACDLEVPFIYRPSIISTGFDSVRGYVHINLTDEIFRSYSFIEIRYRQFQWPFKELKNLLQLTSKQPEFHINHLKHGQRYLMYGVLVHESGSTYDGDVSEDEMVVIQTDCYDSLRFTEVSVESKEEALNISWNVMEDGLYPCPKRKYNVEIDSPELEDPILEDVDIDKNQVSLTSRLPSEGTVRLRAIYHTKEGEWTDPYNFTTDIVIEQPSVLTVINKTSNTICLLWTKSNSGLEDDIECKVEPMLCRNTVRNPIRQRIQEGSFQLGGLYPFSVYSCALKNYTAAVRTITEPELPSGPPKRHGESVISVKNTTASIRWFSPDCLDINGLQNGFIIFLFSDGILTNVFNTSDDISYSVEEDEHIYQFKHLHPETTYVAKVYILNQKGYNPQFPLDINFKTTSRNPEAVRNLITYKRTKTDLWLRWREPEQFSSVTDIEKLKVIVTSPYITKSEEISAVRCQTWPEYYCHRVRGLVPEKEYTISVLTKDSVTKQFGPSTQTNATTISGIPDPPENLQIHSKTAHSVVINWEIPVMLNSNPRYFVASLERSEDSGSVEDESDLPLIKILISEDVNLYQAKFDNLSPASTYTVTVEVGSAGKKATLTVYTPPLDPPVPPLPEIILKGERYEVVVYGAAKTSESKHLSGYLLLLSSIYFFQSSIGTGILDKDLELVLRNKFEEDFVVIKEFSPDLEEERVVDFDVETHPGNFSFIQGAAWYTTGAQKLTMAAISSYHGAHSASLSTPLFTIKQ